MKHVLQFEEEMKAECIAYLVMLNDVKHFVKTYFKDASCLILPF